MAKQGGGNTDWGGGLKNGKGKGFPKNSRNDYDAQRDTNERLHYGPLRTSVRQAAGPLKGESAVNP